MRRWMIVYSCTRKLTETEQAAFNALHFKHCGIVNMMFTDSGQIIVTEIESPQAAVRVFDAVSQQMSVVSNGNLFDTIIYNNLKGIA